MTISLPPLPYADTALEPVITAHTLSFHHGKHHNAYVVKTNDLIAGTDLEGQSLEAIIMAAAGDESKKGLFNNAAQVWNHTFYWESMKPGGGGAPTGAVAAAIDTSFGSYDAFKEKFVATAVGQFGSGWAWLVQDGDGVAIETTANAGLPLTGNKKALMTCDVWEHAYYLDFQNARPAYVTAFLDKLVDWDRANARLAA